mmetsp:Transcript_48712/g.104254  ORF Transcript_48712/g.104254 Transcript_48712/m.104254 type:complete len:245 (-) Transcript_48712:1080-1814(-)
MPCAFGLGLCKRCLKPAALIFPDGDSQAPSKLPSTAATLVFSSLRIRRWRQQKVRPSTLVQHKPKPAPNKPARSHGFRGAIGGDGAATSSTAATAETGSKKAFGNVLVVITVDVLPDVVVVADANATVFTGAGAGEVDGDGALVVPTAKIGSSMSHAPLLGSQYKTSCTSATSSHGGVLVGMSTSNKSLRVVPSSIWSLLCVGPSRAFRNQSPSRGDKAPVPTWFGFAAPEETKLAQLRRLCWV